MKAFSLSVLISLAIKRTNQNGLCTLLPGRLPNWAEAYHRTSKPHHKSAFISVHFNNFHNPNNSYAPVTPSWKSKLTVQVAIMPPPTAGPQPALTAATLLGRRKSSGKQRKFAVFHSRQVITHSSRKSLSLSCRKIENFSFHKMRLKTRADAAAAARSGKRGTGVQTAKALSMEAKGLNLKSLLPKYF